MARGGKTVEFRIRAKDETSAVLKQIEQNLNGLSRADFARKSQEEVARLKNELASLRKSYADVQGSIKAMGGGSSVEMQKQVAEARRLKDAIDDQVAAIHRLNAASSNSRSASRGGAIASIREQRNAVRQLEQQYEQVQRRVREIARHGANKSQLDAEVQKARDLKNQIEAARVEIHRLNQFQKAAGGGATVDRFSWGAGTETVKNDLKQQRQLVAAVGTATDAVEQQQRQLGQAVDATTAKLVRQAGASSGGVLGALRGKGGILDREVDAISSSKGRGFLGLRPYELTNLTYQVNDLVSGVAMGQPPMQVFMQQIGQIAQLFPNAIRGILNFAVSTKGVFVAAMALGVIRAKTLSDTLKDLDRTLSLNADGARYSLDAMAELVDKYDRLGMSVKDARDAVKMFVKEGVDASKIDGLMNLSLAYGKATGMKQGEATKLIAESFGGVDKVRELDREINFLTASQYKYILTLKEAGNETGALAEAQRILQGKLDEINAKAGGPWSRAFRALSDTFRKLTDIMANSAVLRIAGRAFEFMANQIERAADDLRRFIDQLDRIKNNVTNLVGTSGTPQERIEANNRQIGLERDAIAGYDRNDMMYLANKEKHLLRIAELEAENAELQKEIGKETETVTGLTEEQKKGYEEANLLIADRLDKMLKEADLADETAKERFIQQGIEEAIADAKERGLIADEKSVEAMGLMATLRDRLGNIWDTQRSAEFVNGDAISGFVDKVVGVESGGRNHARPIQNGKRLSSAYGAGQFLKSTWLNMFNKYFPERAAGMSDDAILELRSNAEMSRKMIELYAKENAEVIRSLGQNVTEGKLYLAHFLGPAGAKKVLSADPSTPITQLVGQAQINANKSVLGRGQTAGDVIAWANQKMGISKEELGVLTELSEIDAARAKTAEDLSKGTDERLASLKEEQRYASMREREAFIEKTVQDEINKYKKEGLSINQATVGALRQQAAATWDAQNAEKVAMENYERLLDLRGSLVTQFGAAKESGDEAGMTGLAEQIAQVDLQLRAAAASAISFWQSMGGPDADVNIAKINATIAGLERVQTGIIDAKDANNQLAQVSTDAWSTMNQAIANGENAAEAFFNALRQGIAQFIIDITSAIMKQMLFNAISGGSGAQGNGGIGAWIARIAQFHGGGVVGGTAVSRKINPAVFANAIRYHTGGIAGLRANEVPAILKRGEEVLTENDPRHVNNSGTANVNIKQVNVLDPAEIVSRALADEEGQRVMVNWMSRNRHKVSNALG